MMSARGARPSPEGPSPGREALSGTLLGFDFGEQRVGVAVGETSTRIANPLGAIEESANERRFRAIEALVNEWRPVAFIVGRPQHADGSEHPVARLTAKFARRLAARYRLPVVFVDETLTSATAQSELRAVNARATRDADIDALAAALILQSFLDEPEAHEQLAP